MSTLKLRDDINAALKAINNSWPSEFAAKQVTTHAGQVTLADLEYISTHNRVLMVSCLRTSAIKRYQELNNQYGCTARMAIYIGTADGQQETRDRIALALTDLVSLWLAKDGACNDYSGMPQNINGANRYSVRLDKTGINLWAVTFDQIVSLENSNGADLVPLITVHTNSEKHINTQGEAAIAAHATGLNNPI